MQREHKEDRPATGDGTAWLGALPGLSLRLLPTAGRWLKLFIISSSNIRSDIIININN